MNDTSTEVLLVAALRKELIKYLEPSRLKRSSQPPSFSQLEVTGYAPSQLEIDLLARSLAEASCFDKVTQKESKQITIQEKRWLQFTLILISLPLGGK